jgi:hypothetical protein
MSKRRIWQRKPARSEISFAASAQLPWAFGPLRGQMAPAGALMALRGAECTEAAPFPHYSIQQAFFQFFGSLCLFF